MNRNWKLSLSALLIVGSALSGCYGDDRPGRHRPPRGDHDHGRPGDGRPDRPGNGRPDRPGDGRPDRPGDGRPDRPDRWR